MSKNMHLAFYDSIGGGLVKVKVTRIDDVNGRMDAIVTDKSNPVWRVGEKLIEVPSYNIVSRDRKVIRNSKFRIKPMCDNKHCVRGIGHNGDCATWEVK